MPEIEDSQKVARAIISALASAQHEIASVTPDPDAIMKLVAIRACELTGGDGATVEIVEGDMLVFRAASGILKNQLGAKLPVNSSLSGTCVCSDENLLCDDTETDQRAVRSEVKRFGVRSLIMVPLRNQYNSMGVLASVSSKPFAFTETDVQVLQLVAHFMAAAVNQAVAFGAKQALLAEHTRTIVALKESEERFRRAFDHAPIGMALVGIDGRWIKVNHTWCKIVGYDEQELRTLAFHELTHPEDLDLHHEHMRKLLSGEVPTFQTEKRYFHKSGAIVWSLLNVSLLRDGQGKPLYFIAQMQDITERKLAEEVKAQLMAILEATTDFVGTVDLDGKVLYLNRAFREVLGLDPDGQVNTNHISEYHPAWAAEIIRRDGFPTAIREGTWSSETALTSRTGQEVPISQLIIAHKTAKGQVSYFSTVARDITERKKAEEALVMQARVLQNMTEGVCLIDERGVIVYTNAAEERMFGYTAGELWGKRDVILGNNTEEEKARITSEIMEQINSKGFWNGELKNQTKNGQTFITSSSISSLEISGKRYLVCVQDDITEKKRADERIKNSLREKEVLLKEIHHRVKNNLQVISSLLHLQSGYIKDAQTHELFRESQNRVKSMALIHEKLYQSQDLARIDFGEYVLSLLSMLFRSYSTSSGAIKLDAKIDQVSLGIDTAIPIGLMINEMASNSLKYAFPEGKTGTIGIELKAEQDGRYRLVFRDDGIGLPGDFDLDKSSSLGLRLVKILTKQIGGGLTFHKNRGTEFIIIFKEQRQKGS